MPIVQENQGLLGHSFFFVIFTKNIARIFWDFREDLGIVEKVFPKVPHFWELIRAGKSRFLRRFRNI